MLHNRELLLFEMERAVGPELSGTRAEFAECAGIRLHWKQF